MGRGRAKAKQTKVARKLKYYSPETDLGALQRELTAQEKQDAISSGAEDSDDIDDDEGIDRSWSADGR